VVQEVQDGLDPDLPEELGELRADPFEVPDFREKSGVACRGCLRRPLAGLPGAF